MLDIVLLSLGLFVGIVVLTELGRRSGARRLAADPEGGKVGMSTIEGAIFALLGLLVAFSFSGAISRFDGRRDLVVQEANAIGTAWLRLDILPASAQPALRQTFREYLDSRISAYRKVPDMKAVMEELDRSNRLQNEIWSQAVAACLAEPSRPATMLVLPALNEMIDITTTRTATRQMHPPSIIFILLYVLALGCAFLSGQGMGNSKQRCWIHMLAFAVAMAATFYVILDIEYPRMGLIRVDAIDKLLVDLRESMR